MYIYKVKPIITIKVNAFEKITLVSYFYDYNVQCKVHNILLKSIQQ